MVNAPERDSIALGLLAIKPRVSPYPLIRVGGDTDGAYLCPDDLQGIDYCISPGVFRYKRFEDQLLSQYGIKSILIDPSIDLGDLETPLMPGQTFFKKWLGPASTADAVTLESIVGDHCGAAKGDLILQMDIEGSEYHCLSTCPEQIINRFRIIVIELHMLREVIRPWRGYGRLILRSLNRLAQTHVCVHLHPNNWQPAIQVPGTSIQVPGIVECTFLRRDRFAPAAAASERLADKSFVPLPHPLDIVNVPDKPPLEMGSSWNRTDLEFLSELRSTRARRVLSIFLNELRSIVPRPNP